MQTIETQATPDPRAAKPQDRRGLLMAGLLIAVLLSGVDASIVATVLPGAMHEIGGAGAYALAFSVYVLASAASVPAWGPASDRWGRRRVFLVGLATFLAGSAVAGLAPTGAAFLAGRVVQGLGAGALTAVPMSLVAVTFPPERRARAFGVLSSAWGVATVLGPAAGAAIVAVAPWRFAFFINVPFGLLAWALVRASLPESYGERSGRFDALGCVLGGGAAAALVVGSIRASDGRLGASEALLFALGGALLAAFVWQERRAPSPVLPLDLFARRDFAAAATATVLASAATYGVFAFLPVEALARFHEPRLVALTLGAYTVTWSLAALVGGRVVKPPTARRFALGGLALFGAGLWGLGRALPLGLAPTVALAAVAGIGLGAAIPGLVQRMQNAVEPARMGAAMGGFQLLGQLAGALGVGAFGLAYGTRGFGAGLLVATAVVALALAASLALPRRAAAAPGAPAEAPT